MAPGCAASQDAVACAGPALLPGAAETSGEATNASTVDSVSTQGAGQQAGQCIASVTPGARTSPAITGLVGAPAPGDGLWSGGTQPPADPASRLAEQDATLSVKGVQVAVPGGIAAPGTAKPGVPGASTPALADDAAPAQRADGVQSSATFPPDGPRLAVAVPKGAVPAGSLQTGPSGAGAVEHAPGATDGAAPQVGGDLTSQAVAPSFLMPAMLAEAPSPGTGAPIPGQAANPMHAAPSLPTPDQLRPAFAAAAAATGPSHVIVRLDPAELGRVQVGILRQPEGASRIELVAERPETLQLLMRDQPALHRALDLAGIPAEGRTLHFQVGSPDPARDPATAPATQPGLAGGNMGGSMNSPDGGGSQPGSGRGQLPRWSGPLVRGVEPDTRLPHTAFRSPYGLHAGVDITA